MKQPFAFLTLLSCLCLPLHTFAQEWLQHRVKVPKEIQGRWYSEEHNLFIDFQDYGVNIENQVWAYQKIEPTLLQTTVTIAWKQGSSIPIEIIHLNDKEIKVKSDVFPSDPGVSAFVMMYKWHLNPATLEDFKERILMLIGDKLQVEGKNKDWKTTYRNLLQHKLTEKWFANAKKLDTFPASLQGYWNTAPILPKNIWHDSFYLAIFKSEILHEQYTKTPLSRTTTEMNFVNLDHLYGYGNIFLCSSDGYARVNDMPFFLELRQDSLFVIPFDLSFFGADPIVFTNKQQLNKIELPENLLGTYYRMYQSTKLPFLGIGIYGKTDQPPTASQFSKTHLTLHGQPFPITQIYEGDFHSTSSPNYIILATDIYTAKQKYFTLNFDSSFNSWHLALYDIPGIIGGEIINYSFSFRKPPPWSLVVTERQWDNLFYLTIIFIPMLVFLLVILLIARVSYLRRKRRQAQLALRGLRAQLNPHFLFNALSSIQSLVNRNDTENANHYLSGFSKLMRHTLDNSGQDYLSLQEELDALKQYCQLESLRSPFEYHIEVEPTIDTFNTEIPNMLLQPYVENAILHGLRDHSGSPLLEIFISKQGRKLICEIADNGPGIRTTQERAKGLQANNRKQHGMKLSEERLQLLNLRRRKKITLQILDRQATENQTGTRVVITVPD